MEKSSESCSHVLFSAPLIQSHQVIYCCFSKKHVSIDKKKTPKMYHYSSHNMRAQSVLSAYWTLSWKLEPKNASLALKKR
jgi:hypothetical protein